MAEILLTHSYFLRYDPKEYKAMMPYPPLGTLYAASVLRSLGHSVTLFDAMLADSEQDIVPYLRQYQPSIVIIYDDDFNYLTKMCLSRMRQAAFTMSQIAKKFGATVIVHSSDSADHAQQYIEHGADYIVIGEGETTLAELVSVISGRDTTDLGKIEGLAFSCNDGLHRTPSREVLTDLDKLHFPARDLVDSGRYRTLWKKHHGYFSTNIVTTRGCPFHCNWCAKPIYGQVYHSRSPQNVVEEMLLLKQELAPDHLWFCDDIFGLKPGWIPEFADVVQREKAAISYKCLSRADLLLKEQTVHHLVRSGCETVWIGAESGSQKILDAMEKGTTVEQIFQSSALLRSHGLNVGFFLQYGYPGETKEDIELTLQMVKDCQPDEIGISVSYPLPGTKFYENVRAQLGEKQNWIDSKDLAMMYRGTFSPDFYRALHHVTHKKFRIWQGQKILLHALIHPLSMNKRNIRRIAAMAYHSLTLPRLASKLSKFQGE